MHSDFFNFSRVITPWMITTVLIVHAACAADFCPASPPLPQPFFYLSFDATENASASDFSALVDGDTRELPAVPKETPHAQWTPRGLRGGAWDGTSFQALSQAFVPIWGESALKNTPSVINARFAAAQRVLICLWFQSDSEISNGRLLKSPAFQITARGDFCQTAVGKPGQWVSSARVPCWKNEPGQWRFLGVYIEKTPQSTHIRYYAGSPTHPTEAVGGKAIASADIRFSGETCWLTVGNSEYNGPRPFAGKIDEVKIWLDAGAAQAVDCMEQIRKSSLSRQGALESQPLQVRSR